MANDLTWWTHDTNIPHSHPHAPVDGTETPGDIDAPDIVGRTGEEMPEVAHDELGNDPDMDDDEAEDESNG